MQGDTSGVEISGPNSNQNQEHLLRLHDHNNDGFTKFPSEASSELTNQDGTPTGSALSTDHDLQTPLFATGPNPLSHYFVPLYVPLITIGPHHLYILFKDLFNKLN